MKKWTNSRIERPTRSIHEFVHFFTNWTRINSFSENCEFERELNYNFGQKFNSFWLTFCPWRAKIVEEFLKIFWPFWLFLMSFQGHYLYLWGFFTLQILQLIFKIIYVVISPSKRIVIWIRIVINSPFWNMNWTRIDYPFLTNELNGN